MLFLKKNLLIYDGKRIPFADGEFETVVAAYVLHHSDDPAESFSEIVRVVKSNVIILEETYENFFQKLDLVYFDWWFNRKAGQHVHIRWSSYLTSAKLFDLASRHALKAKFHNTEPLRSYQTELVVFVK